MQNKNIIRVAAILILVFLIMRQGILQLFSLYGWAAGFRDAIVSYIDKVPTSLYVFEKLTSIHGLISFVYCISYFLALVGCIGVFFLRKWAVWVLFFYAILEITATFTGFHEVAVLLSGVEEGSLLFYNIQGLLLAFLILTYFNLKKVKEQFE